MYAISIRARETVGIVELGDGVIEHLREQTGLGGLWEVLKPRYWERPYCILGRVDAYTKDEPDPVNNAASLMCAGMVPILGNVLMLKEEAGKLDGLTLGEAKTQLEKLRRRYAFLEVTDNG